MAHPPGNPTEIVILGGGYTAVWGYRSIVRRLRHEIATGTVRITVISASRHHAFHGWTGEVLNGLVRYDRTRTPLGKLMRRAHIIHGWVGSIDLDSRTVSYDGAEGPGVVRFDHLLIGVGSHDAAGRIPGLAEHGWSVKTDNGLLDTRDHLAAVLERAASTTDVAERRRLLSFVIAGGGFAGVEMAAAIAEYLQRQAVHHPVLEECPPQVTLVHSGSALLPEMRPRFERFAGYATRQLADHGVDVRFGVRLDQVTPGGATLDNGTVVPSATVLSTIGQTRVPLAGTESLTRDGTGRITGDTYLRTSHPNVWAGGDAAAVPHVLSGGACPPNALWAIKHGVRVGDNIARTVAGRRLRRFRFLGLGQAASFGVGKGVGELYGIQLTGWLGWVVRWGFFHWFMPSRGTALATISEWLAIPLRGRYFDDKTDEVPGDGTSPAQARSATA